MKAALRVLTAISEHQEPNEADVDELHWYAPSDCERPLDEVVCDAIQRALKDREETRKGIKARQREMALLSAAYETAAVTGSRPSAEEHQAARTRLVREHGQRKQEYLALTARLKGFGIALQQAAENMETDAENYAANAQAARAMLEAVRRDEALSSIARLLREQIRLTEALIDDLHALKQSGNE